MIHPNVLPLASVRNPRDLGGYLGQGDRMLLPHRLLRTGRINRLDEHDRAILQEMGLQTIIDLRTSKERAATPDPQLPGVEHYNVSISGREVGQVSPSIIKIHQQYQTDQYAGFKNMCLNYRDFIEQPHSWYAFQQFFEILTDRPGAILYHCSEGKDRTGICTVFLLYLLGVEPAVIRADYLYSNVMLEDYRQHLDAKVKQKHGSLELLATTRSLASVANEYLDTALIAINKEYGNLDQFLQKRVGMTPAWKAKLQDQFLAKE
ncbi:MAG: tyrosine-protein phosphatase [Lactobacillus sp.]|jgi:protein-tyrosine phosphatase|nr:tyrosine-protein phosphatase [Lactobacillus sp.]MCI1481241.1 tyrosine-protein phosphatase [Lactobacillus sp.]